MLIKYWELPLTPPIPIPNLIPKTLANKLSSSEEEVARVFSRESDQPSEEIPNNSTRTSPTKSLNYLDYPTVNPIFD